MKPQSETELSELVAGATGPLRIVGGGTRGVRCDGAVLETGGLSGVRLYEPGSLTLVVGAGTPVQEVETLLEGEGQRLAFEPMDHRGLLGTTGTPTMGGVMAANISGPRRIQAGAARDFLLGVRFVDGLGRIVKNGGRVMKNVTGYDLVKLMAGAHGTLGVLSEVSLKVLPQPEAQACVLINGLSDADAVAAMARALGSPNDVSGAAHTPSGVDGHPVTMLRIEGFAKSVTYRAQQLCALFPGSDVSVETDPDRVMAGWRWVRDVAALHDRPGDVWRISAKPSDAPDLVARLGLDPRDVLYDWGGGQVWVRAASDADLRAQLGRFDGHATCLRGAAPRFQPEPEPVAALTKGIRQRFDPKWILNARVMGA